MDGAELSAHTRDMLIERDLQESWIWRTINEPDQSWSGDDGNQHFAKAITEREDRLLHVVVNTKRRPPRGVTAFFDRRLRS